MNRKHVSRVSMGGCVLAFSAALVLAVTARAQNSNFTFTVDTSIFHGNQELPDAGAGPRPLAAVANEKGVVSRFVSNEVIFADSDDKLTAFLSKYGGTVIGTVDGSHSATGRGLLPVKLHGIRLDASRMSLATLGNDAAKMGITGSHKFSSVSAAQIAALVYSEAATGTKVALNYVSESHDFPTSTTEQADLAGVSDAFQWPEFYARAWQFVAANGITRRVKLAIIDSGFWLNAAGVPCDLVIPDATCGIYTVSHGASDLPAGFTEGTFIVNQPFSPFAGGPNLTTCTNNVPCPWHGNKTASVALAMLNNKAGAAGTGGQVADPMLLKFDGSDLTAAAAVAFAVQNGADIINMSFGHSCDVICRAGHSYTLDAIMNNALDSGILLVASAGNDGANALDQHEWPCQYSSSNTGNGVYCVGALNSKLNSSGYFVENDGTAAPYSNYGATVNIWGPTNIHAMPDGGSNGNLTVHTGTSASAPYVSGVAAMVKAINPSLDANGIKNIIGNSPYTPGTAIVGFPYYDPKVDFVINPYPAVVAAAGGYHLQPEIHITSPQDGATIVISPYIPVKFTAFAADVNDGQWPLLQGCNPYGRTTITWSSDVDGNFPESGTDTTCGTIMPFDFTNSPEGLRHITAKVMNSAGLTNTATIAVTIKFNHVTPAPVITWPPPNTTVPPGTYIVTGYAKSTDPGGLGNFDCSRLMWNGNVPAAPVPNSNGQCEAQLTFSAGVDQITLSATDEFGDTGKTTVFLNVWPQSGSRLAVQILSPTNGSFDIVTIGSSTTIGLSGNAAPIMAQSQVTYSWYWYLTAYGPLFKRPIGTGQNATWNVQSSDMCPVGPETRNITIQLDVVDSTFGTIGGGKGSQPPITTSGSASVNIQLVCESVH